MNLHNPTTRAALWMVGTLLSFMALAIGGRELSREMGTFQILFFRSVAGLLVISALIHQRGWGLIRTPALQRHLFRNLAHYGGQFGWFYGLAFIPLAEVFAIEFTVPVWVAIMAVAVLGERLTRNRQIAIGAGVLGMLVMLRPGLAVISPAALAVLGAAICYAIAHVVTKQLARHDDPLTILFYMTVMQLPLGLVPALLDWRTPSLRAWPWVFVVGVTALSAHYCLTRAFQLADATVVVPMDFLRLPLIALVGFAFYHEPLDWFVLAGAAIMLLGQYWSLHAEQRRVQAV